MSTENTAPADGDAMAAEWAAALAESKPAAATEVEQVAPAQFANFAPEWHKNRLAYYRKHYGRAAGWFVKACVGWTFADHCVREFWRRAHGLDEKSLLPAWHTFSVFWRH